MENKNQVLDKKEKMTAAERAYAVIKDMTINFKFQPGERINEGEIARNLGLSRAPIREALNRLMGDDLVEFESGKGFYCRKLNIIEVSNLFEVRADLELSAVRQACNVASQEEVEKLLEEWRCLEKETEVIPKDKLVIFDEQFHFDLVSLAKNEERVKFLKNINDRIRFVRQINLETKERRDKFISEHIKIIEAIANRDEKKAINYLDKHLGVNSDDLRMNITYGLEKIYSEDLGLIR